ARAPQIYKRRIAIDDVLGDAKAGRAAQLVVDPAQPADLDLASGRLGSKPGIVEGKLPVRVEPGVRPAACRPIQLVDVAARLVGEQPAGLPRAVGEDKNVAPREGRHLEWSLVIHSV